MVFWLCWKAEDYICDAEECWIWWMFPKIVFFPQNGWFITEHLIKIDDLEVPLFLETPICSKSLIMPLSLKEVTAYLSILMFPTNAGIFHSNAKTLRCKTQHNLWQPSVIFFPLLKHAQQQTHETTSSTFGANPTMLRAWSVGLTFFCIDKNAYRSGHPPKPNTAPSKQIHDQTLGPPPKVTLQGQQTLLLQQNDLSATDLWSTIPACSAKI